MSNLAMFSGANVPAFARNAELSETTKALLGGAGVSTKRISIKGGVFRLVAGGKEVTSIEDRHLDVIIVKAAPKIARVFYAESYDKDAQAVPPDCWSNDGETPDKSIDEPQGASCAKCVQNIAGSGQGQSRACRYQQRLAVVLADDPTGDVLQVSLPATSLFGKEEGDKRPLQAYARYLAAQTPPVNLDTIVTRMKFDTKAESPKLFFSPVRWLDDEEYATVQEQGATKDAEQAVVMTVAQADGVGVSKPAPMDIGGSRPATKTAAKPKPAPVEETEDAAEAAPKTRAKKAAAAPVADADEEPEKRKPAAKETAVPAKKSKLADIVADWDDE
jgi:ribosomal protein L14E/L6E/L27E